MKKNKERRKKNKERNEKNKERNEKSWAARGNGSCCCSVEAHERSWPSAVCVHAPAECFDRPPQLLLGHGPKWAARPYTARTRYM